jgi:AcrR family transcriptional regulator
MSQRHSETDEAEAALLDATRDMVLAVGLRRTTLTDIARKAGLSRMTVYRRFPDAQSLVQALMTREFTTLIEQARADAADARSIREQIVSSGVRGVELLAEHPLFVRILDVDPEILLPYFTTRLGQFQSLLLAGLRDWLAEGMDEGSIRRADPELVAATLELALRGAVLATRAEGRSGRDPEVRAELRRMLDGYLRPEDGP